MNKKKTFCIVLFFLLVFNTFLGIALLSAENNKDSDNFRYVGQDSEFLDRKDKLKSANGVNTLNYSSIFRNTTIIRRGFQSINITVNVSGFLAANKTYMRIYFTNNSDSLFNMSYIPGTNKNFTYTYTPRGNAPLGLQRVSFEIRNSTNYLLNTQTTYTNFTIRSTSMVGFNSSEYYRDEEVVADIAIDESDNYDWEILVVNATTASQQHIIQEFTKNPFQINFTIDESFDRVNSYYYVAVNLTEDFWTTWHADYFGFFIKNSDPVISNIKFSPSSVFREEFCVVTLNASDKESDMQGVNMKITDTNGQTVTIDNPELFNSQGNVFEGNFTIDGSRPKGNYNVEFTADDGNGGVTVQNTGVLIKNNAPDIDGYEINDIDTDERISVPYGDDLEFDFDVSDVEGISYITVELILEDPMADEKDEYEASVAYEDGGSELTIRTEDLSSGTWTVYVSVTDTDGETTDLDDDFDTGPQQITVVPDLISDILPWITLVVGSIIGIIVGIGVGYHTGKSKYAKYKPLEEKIPIKKEKKPAKKPTEEKPTPAKPKRVEKEIEKVSEKEEPKKPAPKRKIKRKL